MKDIKHTPACPSIPPTERIILLRNVNTGAWRHLRISRTATDMDIKTVLEKNENTHRYMGEFNNWVESSSYANQIEEVEARVKHMEHNDSQHVFED